MKNLKSNYSLLKDQPDSVVSVLEDYRLMRADSLGSRRQDPSALSANSTVIKNERARRTAWTKVFTYKIQEVKTSFTVKNVETEDSKLVVTLQEWSYVRYGSSDDICAFATDHVIKLQKSSSSPKGWIICFDAYEEEDTTNYSSSYYVAETPEDVTYNASGSANQISAAAFKPYTYSPSKAVAYARNYWSRYNPTYINMNPYGGDCANFVSQCLYAGGFPMTKEWHYYRSNDDYTVSWINVRTMISYLRVAVGTPVMLNASNYKSVMKAGNPFAQWQNTGGIYKSHFMICVGKNAEGVPIYCAHNNNKLNVPITEAMFMTSGGSSIDVYYFDVVGHSTNGVAMEDEPRLGIVTRSIYSYSTHNGTEHVRRLEEGTEVQIIGKSGIWLQIGENEWVSSNSVYDTFSYTSTTSLGTIYVKKDAQGYSYPGTAYNKTATLLAGTQAEYYAKCGNWYLIYYNNKNVWVRGSYVAVSRTGIITATCRAYKTPEISVNIVNSYSEGTRVVLLGEQNGWYQLPDGSWINKELVYDTTLPDPTSSERIGSGVTLAYGGYVYTMPSGESQKISYLTAGKIRNLYRQSGNWYEIYTNGQYAWVRASDYNVTTSVQRGRMSQGYLLADINTSLGPGEEYMNSTVTLACGTLANVYEVRNGWYKVYRQGVFSWVDGQYFYDLSAGKEPGAKMGSAVMTADAQVYEAPYPSAAKLGTIKTGLRRNVYLRCGDWVQVYNGGRYCWIYAKDMKMDLSVGKKTGVALVLYESNLRTGPGKGFMAKGTAKAHSTVNIYGTYGEWYLTYRMGEYLWINAMQVASPKPITN